MFRAFAPFLLVALPLVSRASDYPFQPVAFTEVRLTGGFWRERQDVNRTVTLPFAFAQCEQSGRLKNFDLAAEVMHRRSSGEPHYQVVPPTQYPFDDTDAYKAIEAASYSLSTNPDAGLDHQVDLWIERIAAAQEPDGYLYTFRTMHPESPGMKWVGQNRWDNESVLSHELYDCGHLYEAGYAHFKATGKRTLLNVCLKNADLLWHDFGDGKRRLAPGHEVVEMGLVKLYRATSEERYLTLAKIFLDARGPGGPTYSQADKRVVDQTEAEGHAVRANYLYCGMADVAALTGDPRYESAVLKIWDDVAATKLYLTGGVGARPRGEAYGEAYELPNDAYNETCAAVALMMWSHRMFLLTGDSKYMDVFERTAYNGFISGVSLSGDRFFYPNPLVYDGHSKNNAGFAGRAPWFGCACCPPNLMRTLASLGGYFYAVRGDSIYVNLYGEGTATVPLAAGAVVLRQSTRYPWDGDIAVTIDETSPGAFALRLRIPGWAQGRPVPSDLYRFAEARRGWSVRINGSLVHPELSGGYAVLSRTWHPGDQVSLHMEMPVETVLGNPQVEALRGSVALERGPVVYCLEGVNGVPNPSALAATASFSASPRSEPALLGGMTVLALTGLAEGGLPAPSVEAIPYYAWNNRGLAPMSVWIPKAPPVVASSP